MIPLSSNSQNLKVVLAVVVLFLGWLIASMIPRSETPWDRTSSSFLARRPVTDADGELVDRDAEYHRLWSTDKENWDPEKKNVTIDYDSQFFGQGTGSEIAADGEETAKSSDSPRSEEFARQWNDEIKVESEAIPGINVGERPKWDDDAVLDDPVADAEELAPPMEPFDADWESEPVLESASAESAPEMSADKSANAGISAETDLAAESESSAVTEDSLIVRADPTLPDGESAGAEAVQKAPTAELTDPEESALPAPAQPTSHPSTADRADPSSPAEPSDPEDDGLIALPTKRPQEQNSDSSALLPEPALAAVSNAETSAEMPLPMKTLAPSAGSKAVPAESGRSDTADEGLISQVSATFPDSPAPQTTTSAYYQEQPQPSGPSGTPVSALAPATATVSSPTAISVYTAGPGENWDGIAAKLGLSDAEAARYFEVNSFRINSDRTVSEGMKLMLPKR